MNGVNRTCRRMIVYNCSQFGRLSGGFPHGRDIHSQELSLLYYKSSQISHIIQRKKLAGRQKKCAGLTVQRSAACDLAPVIDGAGLCQHPAGMGRNQGIQIERVTVLPQNSAFGRRGGLRLGVTHDLASGADSAGNAVGQTGQRSEIAHDAVLPQKRMAGTTGSRFRGADNRAVIADPAGQAIRAAECA